MTERTAGKRGMLPLKPASVRLKLKNYLVSANLPKVPASFGHFSNKPPGGSWGMLGNNNVGDCVMAGCGHEHMLWHAATGKPIPKFTDDLIKKQYFQLSGGLDVGLDPVKAAEWRQNTGVLDANGERHKITAFAWASSFAELDLACYIFGAVGWCWNLPNTSEREFSRHVPWADTSMDGTGGHYTVYVGKNSKHQRIFVTWGEIQAATDAFCEKYTQWGGLAYLTDDYMKTSGFSPEGIDWKTLAADLATFPSP